MRLFSLAVILSLASVITSQAQWEKLSIGVVSSPNLFPYISNDGSFGKGIYRARVGFSAGVFGRATISQRTSLDFGFNYLLRSYRLEFDYLQLPDDPIIVTGKTKLNYNFIDLPIEVNYKMNRSENYDFYLSGGLVNSFGLFSKIKSEDFPDNKTSLDGVYQLGVRSGLGFLFRFQSTGIGIEPQCGYTFLQSERWSDEWKPLYFGLEFSFLLL